MSYVRYKIDDFNQCIYFDQFFSYYKQNFVHITKNQGCDFVDKQLREEPLITISILPPRDKEQWDCKHTFGQIGEIIIYSRERNGKIQAYFQYLMNINTNFNYCKHDPTCGIIFRILMLNLLLQNQNLVYLHGICLTNGDAICANSFIGKTTLTKRLSHNSNLKALCDDGVIIDTEKDLIYPLGYIWFQGDCIFKDDIVDISKPYKLNSIFLLRRDQEEKIYQIDKNEWLNEMNDLSKVFYFHPFKDRFHLEEEKEKWIDFRKDLWQRMQKDNNDRVKKLEKYKPLVITTNTPDQTKKFEVLQDA